MYFLIGMVVREVEIEGYEMQKANQI